MYRRFFSIVSTLAVSIALQGCLPADTRPEPGQVYVTTDLPQDLRDSHVTAGPLTFTTEDDWIITLTNLFVNIGGLGFSGESCNDYAEARYYRVLDLLQPGPQKLGQMWGLNACQVSYSVRVPNSDAILGTGVSASTRRFMQSALVPTVDTSGVTTKQGMAVQVVGAAEKAGTRVSFDWGFTDTLRLSDCQRRVDGALEAALPLVGGETIDVNIAIDPRNLFLATPATKDPNASPSSVPIMQLVADADQLSGNANNVVGIDELLGVAMPSGPTTLSLAEYILTKGYLSLFQYAADGQCTLDPGRGHGPGAMM